MIFIKLNFIYHQKNDDIIIPLIMIRTQKQNPPYDLLILK